MNIPAALEPLIGVAWAGHGSLWFNPKEPPVATFSSRASIEAVAQANVVEIVYTWAYEDDPQEGVLLIGERESGELESSWLDSWHMADSFMISRGRAEPDGKVSVLGSYAAPPGPDWGWRTAIEIVHSNEWLLRMYNIQPGGSDELAFEIRFRSM